MFPNLSLEVNRRLALSLDRRLTYPLGALGPYGMRQLPAIALQENTMQTTIDQYADVLDVRDIIARLEELEELIEGEGCADTCAEYAEELTALRALLGELAGAGGDEQWRGDWYPVTLIRESYFVDYVQELLEDCGEIPKNLPHYIHIDWERTARDIRVDYSGADFHGATYWFRS
jgi:antirestriction protein